MKNYINKCIDTIKGYHWKRIAWFMLACVIGLAILGIKVIGVASDDASDATKQTIGLIIGLIAIIFLTVIDYHFVLKFSWVLYAIMIILLVLVKFMGASGGGAQRWIAIGPFTLQPSELAKIILIVVFANFLAKFKDKINTPGIIAMSLLIAGVPLVLVYVQPDLSTTIVIFAMFACILFTSGISWKLVGGVFAAILPVAVIGIYLLFQPNISIIKTYQLNRIRAFYNIQVSDDDATDYSSLMEQQDNAVIAIGSGGLWGKGLYDDSADSLTNADYLYEPHTDFIFAVIGEKLGFVGCSVVIITLLVIIIYCFRVGSHAPDFAGRVIGCGMGSILGLQTFINLAVTTRMIPNTGLTLPFISYGLSSLVSLCIGIGLVMNVSIQQKGFFD